MLQGEHSAILLTCIKLSFVIMIKIFVLSNFEWPFYTGLNVLLIYPQEKPAHKEICDIW